MPFLPSQTSLQNGAFLLTGAIGRGGFGLTYRARDTVNECDVALKECFPPGSQREGLQVVATDFWGRSQSAALQGRFRAQADQLAAIRHPNLARVKGHFEENGTVYLVMELVEGETLLQRLEAGEIAPDIAQKWVEKIAGALDALHNGGLLHLDVKPENIILRRAGNGENPALDADFRDGFGDNADANLLGAGAIEDLDSAAKPALSPLSAADSNRETRAEIHSAAALATKPGPVFDAQRLDAQRLDTQRLDAQREPVLLDFDLVQPQHLSLDTRPLALAMQCGTPGYAPLEQYAAEARLSPASDFYALGATWYHLATGQLPPGAIERATGTPLAPPRQLRAAIEPHHSAAILAALALQSEDRPQDAAAFLESGRAPVPDIAPDDDALAAPPAAQFLKHGTGVYRVVLSVKQPFFPRRCACCFEKAEATWLLDSPSGRYELPCCTRCTRHQLAARAASLVTFWGSILSLALALLVALISVVTATLFLLFISAACIVMNFAALSYGALKSSRAEEMMRNSCCDLSAPATYVFNGQVHIWRFKNAAFAADFKRRNAANVI